MKTSDNPSGYTACRARRSALRPPPKRESIAQKRLGVTFFARSLTEQARQQILANIIDTFAGFAIIAAEENVELVMSRNADYVTIYTVSVPIKRVKPEFQGNAAEEDLILVDDCESEAVEDDSSTSASFLQRLMRALRVLFPPRINSVDSRSVARQRGLWNIYSDRCSLRPDVKRHIVALIAERNSALVDVEANEVELKTLVSLERGPQYSVSMPVRSVKREFLERFDDYQSVQRNAEQGEGVGSIGGEMLTSSGGRPARQRRRAAAIVEEASEKAEFRESPASSDDVDGGGTDGWARIKEQLNAQKVLRQGRQYGIGAAAVATATATAAVAKPPPAFVLQRADATFTPPPNASVWSKEPLAEFVPPTNPRDYWRTKTGSPQEAGHQQRIQTFHRQWLHDDVWHGHEAASFTLRPPAG
eukprot:SM000160S02561  [mRNA]  locus=s160:284304:286661:- [translate_table: standard]